MLKDIESFLNLPATFLSIIVGLITVYIFFSQKKNSKEEKTNEKELPNPEPQPSIPPSEYKCELGKRHKHLREYILNLSLREMTEFYELESVTKLEKYENGTHELPLTLLQKIESFFFIHKEYMSGVSEFIFEHFVLSSSSNDLNKYLDEGFSPTLLCDPSDNNLFTYIVLSKNERGFKRIIVSDQYGSFASTGSGKRTLKLLIQALSKRQILPSSMPVWQVSSEVWQKLNDGRYYDKNLSFSMGCAHHKAQDVFYEWFNKCA